MPDARSVAHGGEQDTQNFSFLEWLGGSGSPVWEYRKKVASTIEFNGQRIPCETALWAVL
jgi:hypothetical protein